jgi:enoyl-CoA hydratase/carnithine racemase
MTSEILVDKRDDHVAVLSLNRPAALNAIDRAMTGALRKAVADIEEDENISVIVLSAVGTRAFSTGIDLKERQAFSDVEAATFRTRELFPLFREFDSRSKPAVAAVFGHTLAAGFELALSCDLIVAAEGAQFALPEVKWGLIPAAGGCRKLPALIGPARAKELILTAKTLPACDLLRWGAINRVVATGEEFAAALALAQEIAANLQPAVRAAKRAIDEGADAWAACRFDIEVANLCYASNERKEGFANFGAKR